MSGYSFLLYFALTVSIFCSESIETDNNDCFNIKDYYWKHLGTKTPYRYVGNYNESVIAYDDCFPKKIWAILRHGTRYPSGDTINKMNSRLVEIRNAVLNSMPKSKPTLCVLHIDNITQWTPQSDFTDQKALAHEGEEEMVEIAERFKNRFPSLLDVDYTNLSFRFKYTATKRAEQSKYYFTVGLFGRRIAHHVWSPEPLLKDPILRFYKLCPKWIKQVHKNPKSTVEVDKFIASDEAQKVVKNVALRLGYENITFGDIELMYITCGFESSWNRVAFSPWCSVFSEEDMEIVEFAYDLKYYWMSGYGHDINFQQACPLLDDFIQFVQEEDGPSSAFYFTHSGTILKFLSHLGLYYDEFKLTHDRFRHPRLWKVSYMDAFASNLVFVLFECNGEKKLLTLHQERPVKLPGCPKQGLCSFAKILKVYKNSFTNCQFSEICKN